MTIKINFKVAQEIRERYRQEEITQEALSDDYKISRTQVTDIINNKCWNKPIGNPVGYYKGHRVWLSSGYPRVYINGKKYYIHRLVYKESFGVIPDGYHVHHKDGNKLNWSLDNLEIISCAAHTHKYQSGENAARAKLTWDEVKEIRCLYATGNYTYEELGDLYKVAKPTIGDIIRGDTWK